MSLMLNGFSQKPNRFEKKLTKNISKHINYLASDELEGRATGTDGERLSAEYIAKEFQKIGLTPKGDEGYFQYLNIPNLRMAQANSSLKIGEEDYTLFADFFPLSSSSNNGRYTGDLINLGYGINDQGLEHNDYKDKNIRGKAVLINISLPGGNHPHSKFINWASPQFRAEYAKAEGARAVIFYSSGNEEKPDGKLKETLQNSGLPIFFLDKDLTDLPTTPVSLNVDILIQSSQARNVLGYVDNGSAYTVVIGAHHDHLGHGEISGSLSTESAIHNGADDNASGVASLIELAKLVQAGKDKKFSNNNYLFIAFTAEEMGLLGSKHFVKNSDIAIDFYNYMINMDMVGMLDSTLVINGIGTSPAWKEAMNDANYSKKKIAKFKTTEGGIGASDHTSFYLNGIPAVHFFTGQHSHYHKPSDDIEIVNMTGTAYVTVYICKFLEEMDEKGKVEFVKTKQEEQGRMKFKVTLGVMPDYVYDGEGMRIDGVREGKPAGNAGIEKGDIVVTMNGLTIKDMQDYMKALSSIEPGSKVPVVVRRGNELIEKEVQF